MEHGFRILIVSGFPDSLSYNPDSKAQDSAFHNQKVPGFRNPPHMGRPVILTQARNEQIFSCIMYHGALIDISRFLWIPHIGAAHDDILLKTVRT